jgi:HEAT repeat protein
MVPPLGEKLSHQEVSVRLAVLYALETLEMDAAPAAPAVVKALADDNSFVRWGATRALGRMAPLTGKDSAAAVKALGKAVADEKENVRVRNAAAAALARFGIAAKEAVPGLSAAVSKGEPELRVNGMRALQAIGAAAQDAVPTVSAALQTKDTPLAVRLEAAKTLAKLGPAAAAGRPALLEALNDPHPEIRLAAAEALLTIGAKEK